MRSRRQAIIGAAVQLIIGSASADIAIETVTIDDVGNAADATGYGAVNYRYSIGTYEVTNAQYAAFLNAKAKSDPYGLYNEGQVMFYESTYPERGLGGILRTGVDGAYRYSTIAGRAQNPVNFVSFWDAARFVNWLSNGQGNGDTETGTYTLTADGVSANSVVRNAGASWVIPTENEWYKAAYYKGGGLNAGYWAFGTSSDSLSTAVANYGNPWGTLTAGGSYAPNASAYGAFDMAGNVREWNETRWGADGLGRGTRGGAWNVSANVARSTWRDNQLATYDLHYVGFRVGLIPSPSALAILTLAGVAHRRRRRS
jgi:sulfatase modifying factor 1